MVKLRHRGVVDHTGVAGLTGRFSRLVDPVDASDRIGTQLVTVKAAEAVGVFGCGFVVQVRSTGRPPVTVTTATPGGLRDRGVAGITGDAVVGGGVVVTVTGGHISAPEGGIVTAYAVTGRSQAGVALVTIDALLNADHVVVLILCGPGNPGRVTAFAGIHHRQIAVTALADQIRVGGQLIMVSLTWSRAMAVLAL